MFNSRSRAGYVIFVFILIGSVTGFAAASDKQIVAKADSYMKASASFDQFSGSILIARDGKPIISRGYGMASYELKVPNSPNTVFRIASITKQFTAMAVMQLQERGKLKVTDPICDYLENCPAAWRPITIRHLLTHTSGIQNFSSLDDWDEKLSIQSYSSEEFVSIFRDLPLLFVPGEKYRYSNSGYYLLGLIIEKASGQLYEDFLSRNIFEPLKMSETRLYDPKPLIPNMARGYYWSLNSYINAPFHNSTSAYSNGGLISTTGDLLKWEQALSSEKLASRRSLDEMFTPVKNNYGYGWIIEKRLNRNSMGHSGSFNGFSSFLLRFPDERISIIVLSNSDEASATKVATHLAAIVFGESYKLPVPKISDLMAARLLTNGVGSAIDLYRELKRTKPTEVDLREQLLDSLGWDLSDNKRMQDAIEVLKLAVEEYPKSPNAHDSLGEVYLLNKDHELSLKSFQKFLELDPENSHAREMVAKVSEIIKKK